MTLLSALPILAIEVPEDRARDYDPVWTEALAAVIAEQGLIHPIRVREVDGRFVLVAGLHRLRAYQLLGRDEIPVNVSQASSDLVARLEEVMENLARHELIALDRCHHLYELKQVWERMYPETKNGGNKNVSKGREAARTKSLRSGSATEVFSFAAATAEHIGLSQRAIQMAVKIWSDLSKTSRSRLVGTDLAKKQTELKALSEEKQPRQVKILDLILGEDHPEIGNVAQALEFLAHGALPNAEQKRLQTISRTIADLDEAALDNVLAANEDRVIASLKRRGRI